MKKIPQFIANKSNFSPNKSRRLRKNNWKT